MGNEKRSLIAISLSALVFVIYYAFFFEAPPPTTLKKENSTVSQKSEPSPATSLPLKEPTSVKLTVEESPLPPLKTSLIETTLYKVEHSNRGGAILGFVLKDYREGVQKDSPLVNLFKGAALESFLLQFHRSNFKIPEILPYELVQESPDSLHYQW